MSWIAANDKVSSAWQEKFYSRETGSFDPASRDGANKYCDVVAPARVAIRLEHALMPADGVNVGPKPASAAGRAEAVSCLVSRGCEMCS